MGLDRVRADQAGQLLTLMQGPATSTATGIARRFTQQHWRGAEAGPAWGGMPLGHARQIDIGGPGQMLQGRLSARSRQLRMPHIPPDSGRGCLDTASPGQG